MNKTNYKLLFTTSILSSVIAISGFVGDSFAGPKKNNNNKSNQFDNLQRDEVEISTQSNKASPDRKKEEESKQDPSKSFSEDVKSSDKEERKEGEKNDQADVQKSTSLFSSNQLGQNLFGQNLFSGISKEGSQDLQDGKNNVPELGKESIDMKNDNQASQEQKEPIDFSVGDMKVSHEITPGSNQFTFQGSEENQNTKNNSFVKQGYTSSFNNQNAADSSNEEVDSGSLKKTILQSTTSGQQISGLGKTKSKEGGNTVGDATSAKEQLDTSDTDLEQKQLAILEDIKRENFKAQNSALRINLQNQSSAQGRGQVNSQAQVPQLTNQQVQLSNTVDQNNVPYQSSGQGTGQDNANVLQSTLVQNKHFTEFKAFLDKVTSDKLDAKALDDDVDKAVSYAKDIDSILNPHLAKRDHQIKALVDSQQQLLQDVNKIDFIQKNPDVIKALHEKILSINQDPVLGKKAVLEQLTKINNVIRSASLSQEMQDNLMQDNLRKLQDDINEKSKDVEDFVSEDQLKKLVDIRSEIEGSLSKHRKVKVEASIDKSGNRKAAALQSSVKSSANIIRNIANQRFTNMHSSVAAATAAGSDVAAYDSAVWINGFLGSSKDKVDQNKNKAAFFGGSIGYEFKFDDSALLGVAFTVARDNSKAAQQKIGNTNYLVSVYNSTAIDEVLLNAGLFLGGGKATSKRQVVDLDKSVSNADGKYNTRAFGLYGNIGYKISSDQHMLIPSVGLNYSYALNDNYTEVGSTANLVVDKHSASNLAGELALQYSYTMDTPMGMLIPSLQIGFIADLMQKNSDLKQKFIDVHSSTLKVKSVKNNAIKIAPELTLKNAYCDVAISYYREQGLKKYMTQVGSAKVTIKF